jgi:hypothetical protein
MARLYLIIDGYNLLHAEGLGRRRYAAGELERARNRLCLKIAQGLDDAAARATVVVFDSSQAEPNDSRQQAAQRMTILFSSEGRDADAEIEHLLESHSSPKQVLVVSSDHRLHKAARRRKARCIDSEEFLRLLESPEPPWATTKPLAKPRSTRKPKVTSSMDTEARVPLSQEELADVAEEFLNIDIEEIKRSVRKEKR